MTEQNRKWSESPIHDQVKRAGLDNAGEAQALSALSGSLSDTEILDWLEENTRTDYPVEGWIQEMGDGWFDTIREWAKHNIDKRISSWMAN